MPKEIRYRALVDLSLREHPKRDCDLVDGKCEHWLEFKANLAFTPPTHMNIDKCLERGIIERIKVKRELHNPEEGI